MTDTMSVMGRPKKPETTSVRVAKRLVRKLEIIALSRDCTVPELITHYLDPVTDKDFPKAAKVVTSWGMKVDEGDDD